MHEPVQFVRSKFGNALLMDKAGYLYQKSGENQAKTKIDLKCSANAVTIDAFVISWSGGHNHISGQKID